MNRKLIAVVITGLLVVTGVGCAKKEPAKSAASSQTELPPGHPSFGGMDQASNKDLKPVDIDAETKKIITLLNEKYPGEWNASGNILKKGSYTENNNYKLVDEVAAVYGGSMVSIFVGQDRISGTIKGEDGKRVLEGYPTPPEVNDTINSGKATVAAAGSIGSTNYQKIYLPLKSGEKTVAVMSVSIAQ